MTQTATERKTDWLVTSASDENFAERLQAACYGQESVSRLLSRLLYFAKYEAERQELPKGCKVVTLTLKLDDILKNWKQRPCKKTLIRHLELLNEWNYVASTRYQREYTVNIETIQNAVNTPPEKPKKPEYNRRPNKGCSDKKVVTLQPSASNEVIELREKVDNLQSFVDNLQSKVLELQRFVDTLQLYNIESACSGMRLQGTNDETALYKLSNISSNQNKEDILALSSDDSNAIPSTCMDNALSLPTVGEKGGVSGVDEMTHPEAPNPIVNPVPQTLPGVEEVASVTPPPSEEAPKRRTAKKVVEVPLGPPEMPSDDAPWNAETIVQIHEAHQGRRYPNGAKRKSDRVRDKELESAQVIAEMTDLWCDNTAKNKAAHLRVIIQLETRKDNWWLDTNGNVMPHQLVDKDRIHAMVDELKRQKEEKKKEFKSASGLPNHTLNPNAASVPAKPLPYTIAPQQSAPRPQALLDGERRRPKTFLRRPEASSTVAPMSAAHQA